MPLKLKLPERSIARWGSENQEVYVAYSNGFNKCLAEVQSLNPEMEIDVAAMMKVISEHHSGNVQEAWFICQDLIANSHKWIKEKLK